MNLHGLRRVDPHVAAQSNLPPTWGLKVCTFSGCTRPIYVRGLCGVHERRRKRDMALEPEKRTGKDTAR